MILPIYTYGQVVLRKKSEAIDASYPELDTLIENMFETMYNAGGVGLAAAQIGLAIRLFVVDANPMGEDYIDCEGFEKVFINPEIIEVSEETITYSEGCLSIPGINENVTRPVTVTLKYMDAQFVEHIETFDSFSSRIVQHEYDHLEGHVFTERISPIRRQFIKTKLINIAKGKTACRYKLKK